MRYLFYEHSGFIPEFKVDILRDSSCSIQFWKPGFNKILPSGLPEKRFVIWWLMHQLRVFPNRDYCLLLIYMGDTLVHRSCAFPRYFRYPFMGSKDLQIGDTFTDPKYRGQGLATLAILKIIDFLKIDDRRFWYVVEETNQSSIRVIEKAGFKKIGLGARTRRLGIELLGSFELKKDIGNNDENV